MLPGHQTWLIGSSLVHWAQKRADAKEKAFPVLSNRSTYWHGIRGMCWNQLLPEMKALLQKHRPPRVVVVHLGGNDLASTSLVVLIRQMKKDLSLLKQRLPHTQLVWSEVAARAKYRGANDDAKVEKARKTLNASIRQHVVKLGGFCIRHPQIVWHASHLYRTDGVHLSNVGNDMLLQNWCDGLESFCPL